MINAYASERHYAAKLLPIWNALPEAVRGKFFIHARLREIVKGATVSDPSQDGILMVASYIDSRRTEKRFIYVEHGAGQSYDANSAYSNFHRKGMLAALVPGPYCAKKTRAANPGVPVFEIGAPHLAHIDTFGADSLGFAWHWRCSVQVEAGNAYDEYQRFLPEIATKYKTIGGGHPRMIGELIPFYEANKIKVSLSHESLLTESLIIVADNTSLIYEAACLDTPVILLNSSAWRKSKNWGLRFWEALPGPQVDRGEDLLLTIEDQQQNSDQWKEARKEVSELIYGPRPFTMLEDAVYALVEVVYARAY